MPTQLASMTNMIILWFSARDSLRANELGHSFCVEVTKMTVPQGGGRDSCGKGWNTGRWEERVEVTRAIASGDHAPCLKVLHRESKRIELDRTIVMSSEPTYRNQILNNVMCN